MPILAATLDRWRWDTVDVLREDTMVIFANIAGQLDLAAFPEEICIPVLDGLLHWASCSAACALDPLPSTPNGSGPSARRLALEALCKLCVTDSNVDLLLATPPFKRVVCLLDDLVSVLSDAMSDQVAREFAVVLSSSLAAADASAARAIALRRSAVSAFLGFIEAADRQAQQLVQAPGQQGHQMLRDNPEMMGTSIDMLRRAASVVRAIAETSDCRSSLFADHHQRLLQLSMSSTLDACVSSVITDILYLCS
jgi:AT-rich interactive domain-containing protein 1